MENNPNTLLLRNALLVDATQNMERLGDLLIKNDRISAVGAANSTLDTPNEAHIIDCTGKIVCPGLIDLCVTSGEPGHEDLETIESLSRAAAAGGVTSAVIMPHTDPVIDDIALVDFITRLSRDKAHIRIFPAAAITKGMEGKELTEMGLLLKAGARFFCEGRLSIQNAELMRNALTYANNFGGVVAHFPAVDALNSGDMNQGEFASKAGLRGIPTQAESIQVERDLALQKLTGGNLLILCASCRDSIAAIKNAKEIIQAGGKGNVWACASIAHLTLNELDIHPYRTFFKFSPPLRSEEDRLALVQAVADGTIDFIVSNHDPQNEDTKRLPFGEAASGAVGVETLAAASMRLVHDGSISWMRWVEALSSAPAKILGLPLGTLKVGATADIAVIDPNAAWRLDRMRLRSRSKNTPYSDAPFLGRVEMTVIAGQIKYRLRDGVTRLKAPTS